MELSIIEKVEKPVNDLVLKASKIMVTDIPSRLKAGEFLKVIKSMQKEVESTFDPIIDKQHKAWKEGLAQKAKYFDPLKAAEATIKNKAIAFDTEQERIAREKQAKIEAEARAEEERIRKELEAKAKRAEKAGKDEKAEVLREQAEEVHVETPIIKPQTVKIEGQSMREDWYAEVIDFGMLVKAVSEGKAPLEFLSPCPSALNQSAKWHKAESQYPGVVFKSRKIMSAR